MASPSHPDNPTIDPGHGVAAADTPTLAGLTAGQSALSQAELIAAEGGAIGPYTLVSVIGEGGFGVVYLAEQTEPIRRRVAVKVVKPGMDSRAVLQRFEQERQALAIIDHPNVARVLDAGATSRGRPYFVMEFVSGEPITAYCDRHRLPTRQRLELFIPVCEAVHHGHTKGIIHRDLKPSNILVALVGEKPIPKVIDFGVAKALHARGEPSSTEVGQIVGTPEYMSPEQAEMSVLDIDTRTDVYSLGVVLYELLTGVLPMDSRTIRSLSLPEMQRVIRDVDPPRPSTRLSTLAAVDAHAIADRRRAELHTLSRELSRELEWIPLKAMRKDRTERYRSAVEMSDDVRNYLEGRPLLAGPESALYRLRKYVRRHRLQVSAAAAVVLALTGGLIGTSLALAEAREANRRADELRQRLLEVQNQLIASRGGDPESLAGPQAPTDVAIRSTPAPAGPNTGAPPSGDSPSKVSTETDVVAKGVVDDRMAEAETAQRRVVELSAATLGAAHPDTLASRANLARMLAKRGRLEEAETVLRAAFDARPKNLPEGPVVVAIGGELGSVLVQRGKAAEAEAILRAAADVCGRLHGAEDNRTLSILNDLARSLRAQKKLDDAAAVLGRVAAARQKNAPDSQGALVAAHSCGVALREAGKLSESEAMLTVALGSMRRVFGDEHAATTGCWRDLGLTLVAMKQYERAETILLEMHRKAAARFGAPSRLATGIAGDLAGMYESWGKADEAGRWREAAKGRGGK